MTRAAGIPREFHQHLLGQDHHHLLHPADHEDLQGGEANLKEFHQCLLWLIQAQEVHSVELIASI